MTFNEIEAFCQELLNAPCTYDPECVVLRIETKDIVVIYEALLECFTTIDLEVDEDTSDVPWPFE